MVEDQNVRNAAILLSARLGFVGDASFVEEVHSALSGSRGDVLFFKLARLLVRKWNSQIEMGGVCHPQFQMEEIKRDWWRRLMGNLFFITSTDKRTGEAVTLVWELTLSRDGKQLEDVQPKYLVEWCQDTASYLVRLEKAAMVRLNTMLDCLRFLESLAINLQVEMTHQDLVNAINSLVAKKLGNGVSVDGDVQTAYALYCVKSAFESLGG